MVGGSEEKEVCLSEYEEGQKLITIPAKAFLSCKTVEVLKLPESLEIIEDWAFAHAKNLKEIWLPAKNLRIGKKVFLGCESLERILFVNQGEYKTVEERNTDTKDKTIYDGVSFFLGSVARLFPEDLGNKLLEKLGDAGNTSKQWDWLEEYDEALAAFLNRPDEDGFVPAFIGWFDVEDLDDQKLKFIKKHCADKLFVAFQRLMFDRGLSEKNKALLEQYVLTHNEVLTELFLEDAFYRDNIRQYKIWKAAGGLTRDKAEFLMEQHTLKRIEIDPEIAGFLIECCMPGENEADKFFADFTL